MEVWRYIEVVGVWRCVEVIGVLRLWGVVVCEGDWVFCQHNQSSGMALAARFHLWAVGYYSILLTQTKS